MAGTARWVVILVGRTGGDVVAGWVLVGAPLDCSGTNRGEARAPKALRDAGLVERIGARDAGDTAATIDNPDRDARTGVIGFEQLRRASWEVNSAVTEVLEEAGRPLIVGGDCAILVGALAAAKEHFGRVGLAFIDGHLDFFGGDTSPSGEAADMDLAFVTGYGPEGLVDLGGGTPPITEPGDVVVMGYRDDPEEEEQSAHEADLVDERVQLVDALAIKRGDPERLGRYVAERLEAQAGRFWVHFDVDAFDAEEMPAVTYPLPDGLGFEHTEALLRPLASSPALVGLSVADFVPDKDPDGKNARRLVELLVGLLSAPRSSEL